MLSSPEIFIAGASVVDTSGGRVDTPQWPGVFGPTGVQEQGAGTRGALGNLRGPSVSTDMSGSGTGIPTPRSPRPCVPAAGSKQGARVVSPSEGNEVRREGRMGVGAFHSSDEAGERALPDPVERRGRRVVDRKPEPRRGLGPISEMESVSINKTAARLVAGQGTA